MHQIIKTVKKIVPALTTALTSPKLGTSLRRGACLAQNCGLSPRRDMQQWPLGDFTSSRSGEPFSLERDKASLKTWLTAWASARGRILGDLLASSPRREYQFSPIIPCMQPRTNRPNILFLISHKHKHFQIPFKHKTVVKQATYSKKTKLN